MLSSIHELAFLDSGGTMGESLRRFDWAGSPLGDPEDWSSSLKSYVGLMLSARQPMFMAWGPQQIWLYNDAFIPILGEKHPQALGRPSKEVWAEAWGDLEPLFVQVFAGQSVHMEGFSIGLARHGRIEEAVFDFSYTPVRDDCGTWRGLFGVCIETTARLMAQRQEEHELLWRHAQDLLVIIDARGVFQDISGSAGAILGYKPEEMIAKSVFDFIHPEDIEPTRRALVYATEAALPIFVNRYRHKDGSYRWLSWMASPAGELIYATGRDITKEHEQSEALATAEEALRQSQKMEAVGQLTGGLAHDFNNLLAGIGGSLELLERRLGEGRLAGVERYIAAALSGTRRAAALTQRLLAFSRRQTLDPRPVDVNKLTGGMEDFLRRSVGPTVEIEIVGAGGLWTTNIDPSQLENALLNLCINGRDAMAPRGGRLTIETANKWLDERAAKVRELPPGQYISLCVTDTGTGMKPEIIERAFEPFFTTKPLGQGTGLGLSMIYGFVRQSGGQVRLYSELGEGTTVCLYLPRYLGDQSVDDEENMPPASLQGGEGAGETVLVVDDEATIRMLLVEVLGELGYQAIEAADGPAALKILEAEGRIDLLVTDVGLPGGLNGRQIADAGRSLRPELKVLFITGYAENAVIGNGHLEPGMEVITKPFAMTAIGTKIRDMIER